MRAVADLEANGLLPEVTTIWCGVFKDIDTKEVYKFGPDQMAEMCKFLDDVTVLVMHNGIDYDVPLLEQVLGYVYEGEFYDTYLMSMLSNPDRKKSFNLKGKSGAHSLANFGCIFGRSKPEHEDWSMYSEDMLHRCSEDTEIGFLTFNYLLKEMGIEL